jgi:hypothetical protein
MNYLTQEWQSSLLKPRLVREDVYLQNLTPDDLSMIREALDRGLMPKSFRVVANALILRFELEEG